MRVLVLGGHGFIGSHIVESLIDKGYRVRVFARHSPGFHYEAEWFNGDFLDKSKLSEALIGMDAVIHCISTTVPVTSASDPVFDITSNLIGTVELLRLMQLHKVPKLVYLSSGGTVYGNPLSTPVCESAPLNPVSSYGAVKVSIEKFIGISESMWGVKSVIMRPSNPFGERQGHKGVQGLISTILNNIIKRQPTTIYGDGSAVRDYIYVKDLANLVCKSLMFERTGIYNAGSGTGYSVSQIINLVESVTGMSVPVVKAAAREFDVKEIVLNTHSAMSTFNWYPKTSIDEGIRLHLSWLKRVVYGCTD